MAIQSFVDEKTKHFFETGKTGKRTPWVSVKKIALRKLDMLEYASELKDLRSPPGNRLEALSGDLKGFDSIRINSQWRIIFSWNEQGPEGVQIIDYH